MSGGHDWTGRNGQGRKRRTALAEDGLCRADEALCCLVVLAIVALLRVEVHPAKYSKTKSLFLLMFTLQY